MSKRRNIQSSWRRAASSEFTSTEREGGSDCLKVRAPCVGGSPASPGPRELQVSASGWEQLAISWKQTIIQMQGEEEIRNKKCLNQTVLPRGERKKPRVLRDSVGRSRGGARSAARISPLLRVSPSPPLRLSIREHKARGTAEHPLPSNSCLRVSESPRRRCAPPTAPRGRAD